MPKLKRLAKVGNWIGAAGITAAPFLIDSDAGKMLAILALVCLTRQALELKAFNLAVANLTGILGYLFSIVSR
jgi:hypothetical protein